MNRKGIILAGGTGSRLYPITQVVSKQLLPVYDKPMIYYPLSVLMLAGIREILIITTPEHRSQFEDLLGDGSQFGIRLEYVEQPSPDGLAQALILAEDFLAGEPSCLVLGDNIFYGSGLAELLRQAHAQERGATVFGYWVRDPERYGILDFDDDGNVVGIAEKPQEPASNYAVTGLYFYDAEAPAMAKSLQPSARGELEITDLNRLYLEKGALRVQKLDVGFAWLDTGTHRSLLEASSYIETMEMRQGLRVACLEEIAWQKGWISADDVRALAKPMLSNDYGQYLVQMLERRNGRR